MDAPATATARRQTLGDLPRRTAQRFPDKVAQLDGVAEVAVFGVSHPRWVEAVVAVVVPKPGAALTEQQVIEHTRAHLAGYKTPKHVVVTDALPKNPSGKILKRQLREQHAGIAAANQ